MVIAQRIIRKSRKMDHRIQTGERIDRRVFTGNEIANVATNFWHFGHGARKCAAREQVAVEANDIMPTLKQHGRQYRADIPQMSGHKDFHLFVPNFPGSVAAFPIRAEYLLLAHRIHALPERLMPVRHQLVILRKA